MSKIYPHKCQFCNSSSRNVSGRVICSNTKCKSWKNIRAQMAKIKLPKFVNVGMGDTSDDPIMIKCSNCDHYCYTSAGNGTLRGSFVGCMWCHKDEKYKYEIGKWYKSLYKHGIYITQYVGMNEWNMDTEIKILRQGTI